MHHTVRTRSVTCSLPRRIELRSPLGRGGATPQASAEFARAQIRRSASCYGERSQLLLLRQSLVALSRCHCHIQTHTYGCTHAHMYTYTQEQRHKDAYTHARIQTAYQYTTRQLCECTPYVCIHMPMNMNHNIHIQARGRTDGCESNDKSAKADGSSNTPRVLLPGVLIWSSAHRRFCP